MENDNKVFGLMAQAEDIQKHAISLQNIAESVVKNIRVTAEDAFRTLPEATRGAVRDAAREIIVEGTEKASKGLLDASSRAMAASEQLRGAGAAALIKHIAVLFFVAVVISAVIYFGLGFLAKQRAAELDELIAQARAMQATVDKLSSQYGKVQFNTCGGRPCVRVDERPGRYGDPQNGELYMVIFGY